MIKAKTNVLFQQKRARLQQRFRRDSWEGTKGFELSPRRESFEEKGGRGIRWLPLLPAVFALVALTLAFCCLLAGSRPGYMDDYAILTLNTSSIGLDLVKPPTHTTPSPKAETAANPYSALLNPLLSTSQTLFNKLTSFFAKRAGLQDFYSIHMMNYCYGSYNLASTSVGKSVTACSTRTILFAFDPMPILQKAFDKADINLAVEQLTWPEALQDGIAQLKMISHIALAMYCIAIVFSFFTIFACAYWMSPYSAGSRRIVALAFAFSGVACAGLFWASVMITLMMEKGTWLVEKLGFILRMGPSYAQVLCTALLLGSAVGVTFPGISSDPTVTNAPFAPTVTEAPSDPAVTNAPAFFRASERDVEYNVSATVYVLDLNGLTTATEEHHYTMPDSLVQPSAAPSLSGCAVPPFSQELYEASGAKEFIKDEFACWKESQDPNQDFLKWFFDYWLPGVSMDEKRCGSGFHCSVGSPENVKHGVDCRTLRQAYYAGQVLATINHRQRVVHEAFQDARSNADALKEDWLTLYSEWDTVKREKAWNDYQERLKASIITNILLGVSGVLNIIGGVLGKDNPLTIPNAIFSGLIVNPMVFTNSIKGVKGGRPGAARWERDADVREVLKQVLGSVESLVEGNHRDLMRGQQDLGGKYIWEHAAGFDELDSNALFSQMRKRFDNTINGPMLDFMWRVDHVYITQSNVGPTREGLSCQSDGRGPPDAKVCLDEYPGKVFYIFKYSAMKNNPVMLPMGWNRISGLRGDFNFENVVRASVAHYTLQGLDGNHDYGAIADYLEGRDTETASGFDAVKKVADTHNQYLADGIISRSAGPLSGLFHIPIARCDGGECISGGPYDDWHHEKSGDKIAKTTGFEDRNFPCIVGAYDTWNSEGEPTTRVGYADEQQKFLIAANLVNHEQFWGTCNSKFHHKCKEENKSRNPKFVVDEKIFGKLLYNKYSKARCGFYMRNGELKDTLQRSRGVISREKKELGALEAQVKQKYQETVEKELQKQNATKVLFDKNVQIRMADLAELDEREKGIWNNGTAQPAFTTLPDLPMSLDCFE
ncbi:gb [Venturia nashicola]|nr:gb [Venturia nashicola]